MERVEALKMNEKVYEVGIDYDKEYETVNITKMSKESVFDVFNGVVDAVEEESNSRTVLCRAHDGRVSFSEIRALELVETYDEFINDSNFKLDVFSVGKMDMENFWSSINRRNSVNIANKAVTYGKSSIYVVRRNKVVVGFLLNNMTFDGQNMYFLTSKRLAKNARSLFKGTGKYPSSNQYVNRRNKSNNQIEKRPTRWTRIINYLSSVGATALNAWEFLETEDSKFFYAELKKHNYLSDGDKQLLKSIRKMKRVASFDIRIETLESRIKQLEDLIKDYEETEEPDCSVFEYFDAMDELAQLESKLISYGEEHNSDVPVTTLEDYKW